MNGTTRRGVLRGIGASAITAGLTGCLGRGSATAIDSVTVAYVPIFPNMQHYVMNGEGYYDEVAADVEIERFSAGPDVVKAFASGDVDLAMFGISPAMVLTDKGVDGGILAANSRNGFKLVGTEEVAALYNRAGSELFDRFEAENDRQLRFGVPPDGSVPDVVLRYWIEAELGVGELASVAAKSTVPPAKAVQTIQSGEIDATMIQEPFATVLTESDGFRELAWSGNILDSHPVTVLLASQRVLDAPEVAQSLVEQHVAATEFVAESPVAAAADAAAVIGTGVSESLAETAMESRASDFLSDPRAITDETATMGEIVSDLGLIEEPIPTAELFAFEAYDAL